MSSVLNESLLRNFFKITTKPCGLVVQMQSSNPDRRKKKSIFIGVEGMPPLTVNQIVEPKVFFSQIFKQKTHAVHRASTIFIDKISTFFFLHTINQLREKKTLITTSGA